MASERRSPNPERTKADMVQAALAVLQEAGFAGTTARALAARGGFNQALIYYHFGGVPQLLLAALDRSSEERLESYRAELGAAGTLEEKVAAARRLYRKDVEGGHITVLSELIAASLAHPELRPELVRRLRPWLEFTQEALREALPGEALLGIVPLKELSSALVALYLGLNLLSLLDPKAVPAEELFSLLEQVVPLLEAGS
jgi:AcrR family transcriptional regulator